jgi:hypothetical protein
MDAHDQNQPLTVLELCIYGLIVDGTNTPRTSAISGQESKGKHLC